MAIDKALLLIADIGGYTRFMKEHRFGLSHAQDTIAELLEPVIDRGRGRLPEGETVHRAGRSGCDPRPIPYRNSRPRSCGAS
ncbi:MAG TPA: hypothetical protein VF815_21245 [Myxococcaceae bacterium]|jgi:hypothetical protein